MYVHARALCHGVCDVDGNRCTCARSERAKRGHSLQYIMHTVNILDYDYDYHRSGTLFWSDQGNRLMKSELDGSHPITLLDQQSTYRRDDIRKLEMFR